MQVSNRVLKHTTLFCTIIVFTLVGTILGQPRRRALPDSSQIVVMVDTLAAKLSLSDSVKSKVNAIYLASFTELKKELEKNPGDFRATRNVRREITEKREKEVKAFLNDTQKEAFQKIIEEQHHKMQERMRGRRRQY